MTGQGRDAGDAPVNALLAALAEGSLADEPLPEIERIDRLTERALNQLHIRHADEQAKRDSEFEALREAKLISLEAQHQRRKAAIENRIATSRSRGRQERSITLFHKQLQRAEQRHSALHAEITAQAQPEIQLEPLAACVIDITVGGVSR